MIFTTIISNASMVIKLNYYSPISSIGNGGINTKCAKTTNMEKCAKIPRSNISGMPRSNPKVKYFRNAKVKSQGQIFQECQGQIPRSNPKVKNFRNAKVKSQGQEFQECQGQECLECVECAECAEWEI